MKILEILTALSGSLYLVTMTVVGVRLLMLAERTRRSPEALLGFALLLGGTLGASLEVAADAVFGIPSRGAGIVMAAGKSIAAVGIVLYNFFVWRVFRPNSRAAAGLFFALLAITLAAIAGFAASGSFATGLLDMRWFVLELIGRLACPLWMIAESFAYWLRMRKRVTLGLADPLVANRFLLWGIGASFGVLMLATSVTPRVAAGNELLMSLNLVVLGMAGIASSIPYWLAFFPPESYRRWVAGAKPA